MKLSVPRSSLVFGLPFFCGVALLRVGPAEAKPVPTPPPTIQQSGATAAPPASASSPAPPPPSSATVLTIPPPASPPPPTGASPPAPPPTSGAPRPLPSSEGGEPRPVYGAPPGYGYEPPIPPRLQKVKEVDDGHTTRAPDLSLWLGTRLGWDLPLGAAFRDAAQSARAESSFVGAGPVGQLDAGVRVGRKYVPFLFYARTFGAEGSATTSPGATARLGLPNEPSTGSVATVTAARSDLVGLGMRYLFSPDDWGAAIEISYAVRFTRATFSDGASYKADATGVLRLAAGVDVRTGRLFTLTPMVVATVGSYSDVTVQRPGGSDRNVATDLMTHGYVGASLGGSFDLFSKWD